MRTSKRTKIPVRRRASAVLSLLGAGALAVLGVQVPAQAAAGPGPTPNTATSTSRIPYEAACGTAKQGQFSCQALRRTDIKAVKGVRPAAETPTGYGAADLQSAYNLPADGGAGQTVAIVDAYDDPNAEADLAVYRQQYGLPACTTDNGCFKKVDQRGGSDYPAPSSDWAGEISLDLDMVSATAPNAHILLVEADDDLDLNNMGIAVDEAVALGAKVVSNSYSTDYRFGGGEDPSETTTMDAYYNHPGVAMVASSGDYGYGVGYPAASQYVTSVGGTSLVRDPGSARGWSETAWSDAGSGCSLYEPKPAFQQDTGCANRAVADVSADADLATGVAVYQTYGHSGWALYGGTSVASPIIAGVFADAGTPTPGTYPNSYPYAASGVGLNDVSGGSNGSCTPSYLCNGTAGYDGPTGLGSPNGVEAFRSSPHGELSGTVTDTATGKPIPGATVTAGTTVTHTGGDGAYSISLRVGTYDIAVDAFGYATGAARGLAITDGDTLTKNFALSAVPSQTVSGKVTDGSGHGWPLYARITVDGVPGGPVWTDPDTGAYDLPLPQGHTYTLHVDSAYPGYLQATRTITVSDTPQSVNVPVQADSWSADTPGYAVHVTDSTSEPFDSTDAAPQGWSVVNADGTDGGWQFDDPGSRGNNTGGDGGFAIVDSDHYGGGGQQDSQLISPVYDLTGKSSPELSFNTDYLGIIGQTAQIDVTADGGTTWTNVWQATTTSVTGPTKVEVPLTDYAGKKVQLRFHYTGGNGWWWAIDNVLIGQRDYVPTPGGLVVGTVADANTGAGLIGATVTSQDDPTLDVTTVATPDDPGLGDGFYTLFSTDFGQHGFTAGKVHYTDLAATVKVDPDSVTPASFKLQAGQLTVQPDSVSASVGWGKQTTQQLKVRNSGGAPATLKLNERSGSFHIQAAGGAPLKLVKGDFSPLFTKAPARQTTQSTAGPSGTAWQPAANLPQSMMDNAVGAYDGKIYSAFGFSSGNGTSQDLYALDPATGTWTKLASAADARQGAPAHGFIDGKFYAVGGWGTDRLPDPKLEIYDPDTNTWATGASTPEPYAGSGSAVLNGRLYVVGGCDATCGTTDVTVYDPATDSWSQVAPYPEPISWSSCAGIGGKLYCGGGDTNNGEVKHSYVYDPETDSWSAIADMPITLWGSAYTSANGLLLVSGGITQGSITNQSFAFDPEAGIWSALPNANTAVFRGGGAAGFYKVGGGTAPGASLSTVELLPGFDQVARDDVSWLSDSAQQLTLQPGASATVTVTLDASVPEITQPGDYSAQLTLSSDTPYSLPLIPVALHVDPPKTWGKITGTVTGATLLGGTAPIAGATVQIDSWAGSYSLTTAADGSYALWLDTRNNPLDIIVAKDGYQPVSATVKITKGATVIRNFTLKRK